MAALGPRYQGRRVISMDWQGANLDTEQISMDVASAEGQRELHDV